MIYQISYSSHTLMLHPVRFAFSLLFRWNSSKTGHRRWVALNNVIVWFCLHNIYALTLLFSGRISCAQNSSTSSMRSTRNLDSNWIRHWKKRWKLKPTWCQTEIWWMAMSSTASTRFTMESRCLQSPRTEQLVNSTRFWSNLQLFITCTKLKYN